MSGWGGGGWYITSGRILLLSAFLLINDISPSHTEDHDDAFDDHDHGDEDGHDGDEDEDEAASGEEGLGDILAVAGGADAVWLPPPNSSLLIQF